jgi:hypothetical protein
VRAADQRTVIVGTKSAAALWASFAAEVKEQEPPADAMTAREFAEKFNIPLDAARGKLSREANAGRMVATSVKRAVGGQMRTVIYYTPKA